MNKIEALSTNNASSGNIPMKSIRDAKEVICPYLTRCINVAINKCYFPDIMKEADVSAIHVKYWDLEVWDLGPNGLYLLFSLALNTYLQKLTYYDTSSHDL